MRRSACSRAASKFSPCAISSAPSCRIAATLTGFARSGTQMRACTPNSRAANATDWPWLPVEAAISPRARSSSESWATRLRPPRILNAPVGWWFSCFTWTLSADQLVELRIAAERRRAQEA